MEVENTLRITDAEIEEYVDNWLIELENERKQNNRYYTIYR